MTVSIPDCIFAPWPAIGSFLYFPLTNGARARQPGSSSLHTRKHQSLFCDFRPVVSGPIFARMTLPSHPPPPSNPSSDIKIYFMRLSNKNEREKVCHSSISQFLIVSPVYTEIYQVLAAIKCAWNYHLKKVLKWKCYAKLNSLRIIICRHVVFSLFHFSCDIIEETVPYSVRHVSNVYSY
jgi:hypothetical protein